MDLKKIPAESDVYENVNVVIEVPYGSNPVKYEFDKKMGVMMVDRILATPMYYPCNYGFIPNTLAGDGDPIDALVITRFPLIPGCVISGKPIGVLVMEDEGGMDEKILIAPSHKLDHFSTYENLNDLPEALLSQIKHFFEHYKDLEKNKWVKVKLFGNKDVAKNLIKTAIESFNAKLQ